MTLSLTIFCPLIQQFKVSAKCCFSR
jgi:hypothetical protein